MHKARIVRAEYRQKLLNPELKNRLIDILEEWLEAIHDGTANYRLAEEGYEKKISPDSADSLIGTIMEWYREEFSVNRAYWNELGIYQIPDYTQIRGQARIAFAQDLHRAVADLP